MRVVAVLLLTLLCSIPAAAQSGLSGYVLTLPVYQRYGDDQLILPGLPSSQVTELTRLRLRAPIPLGETTYLQVETEAAFEYASEGRFGLQNTSYRSRQMADLTTEILTGQKVKGLALIDRLFLRFDLLGVDIMAGRQRISWGVGRVWSPTDLFNPINPAILGKIEKDGADALLARVTLGDFSDISFVVNGQRESEIQPPSGRTDVMKVNAGARIRTLVESVALSAMGGVFDERGVVGGDVTLDVLDAGVRLEALYGFERTGILPSEGYLSLVLGVDNQFTSRLYAMAGYFYNGRGETDRLRYSLAGLLNGDITNLGRHILAVQSSYLVHPLATVSLTIMRNLNDESMLISPQVLYLASESISLSLGGQYFTGGRFSEYWWYPSTVFGRADLYF